MTTLSDLARPVICLGERVYSPLNWHRRDDIYLDGVLIGHIFLTRENRAGVTYCHATSRSKAGRAIDWCAEQASLATHTFDCPRHKRTHRESCPMSRQDISQNSPPTA